MLHYLVCKWEEKYFYLGSWKKFIDHFVNQVERRDFFTDKTRNITFLFFLSYGSHDSALLSKCYGFDIADKIWLKKSIDIRGRVNIENAS